MSIEVNLLILSVCLDCVYYFLLIVDNSGIFFSSFYDRALQIVRENGSFGFVIKGSNPAYIETADPGGPADKAGLQPGDYVMKLNGIDVR